MRTKLIALCILLLAGAWRGGLANDPVPSAEDPAPVPKLSVPIREIDLGEVDKGEAVEAKFELRNDGDAPLRILKAKPG